MSVSKSLSHSHTHGINKHTTPSVTVNNPSFVSPPKPSTSCMSTMPPSSLKYIFLSPCSGQKSSTVPNTGAGDGGPSAASLTAAQLHMTAMSKTVGWEPDEEPLYVNAKQYHRIMKRREMRAKLEATGKIPKKRKKYLYESRHKHAMARTRGNGGKFSKEN
ncbi:nuclear transcription factor Y subunit alpha-like isoform X5 [Branchiostoma floridae]|uniref:Nuclear transcription factor Y subunit n=1 Tax=Branchiostoma floridae TaxID=7739 RepID=A0A9J7KY67_BRAFL|nr:nuclear transcription factor Y subunit alpha-like isoform X5 [Branchiostoma floridae]